MMDRGPTSGPKWTDAAVAGGEVPGRHTETMNQWWFIAGSSATMNHHPAPLEQGWFIARFDR